MKKLNQAGLTLVETVITLAVTSMMIFVIMDFTVNNLVLYTSAEARNDLQSEAQRALDIANNDIRLSATVEQNNRWEDDNAPDNELGWASNQSTLVLASIVEDGNGDVIFADPNQYLSEKNNIVYFVDNNTLYRRMVAAPVDANRVSTTCPAQTASATCRPDTALAQNVESFTITYIDNEGNSVTPENARAVELSIELSTNKFGRTISVDYVTRTVFRNG